LESLEELFDYEFKAVFYKITEPGHCESEDTKSNIKKKK
jgi:hypothetical protein